MTEDDKPSNIRARPILMLFVVYGLRNGEVCRLRLDDLDWEHEVFRVESSKTGQIRTYPLVRSVGDAILRYLQEVRPRSPHRELFLSFHRPFRPVRVTLWKVVNSRLQSMHFSLPHNGPHALVRHGPQPGHGIVRARRFNFPPVHRVVSSLGNVASTTLASTRSQHLRQGASRDQVSLRTDETDAPACAGTRNQIADSCKVSGATRAINSLCPSQRLSIRGLSL
jgi:hypothetical protein